MQTSRCKFMLLFNSNTFVFFTSKNWKVKTYKTIILLVTLRNERKLRVLEK